MRARPRYRICTWTSRYWFVEELLDSRWVRATEAKVTQTWGIVEVNTEAPVARATREECEKWIDEQLRSHDAMVAYLNANPPREYP